MGSEHCEIRVDLPDKLAQKHRRITPFDRRTQPCPDAIGKSGRFEEFHVLLVRQLPELRQVMLAVVCRICHGRGVRVEDSDRLGCKQVCCDLQCPPRRLGKIDCNDDVAVGRARAVSHDEQRKCISVKNPRRLSKMETARFLPANNPLLPLKTRYRAINRPTRE